MTTRRAVTLCRWAKQRKATWRDDGILIGTGRSGQLFAFSWRDVACLLSVQVGTARKMAKDGKFSPTDLESIARFWSVRQNVKATAGGLVAL
jgi:hypothetical protein